MRYDAIGARSFRHSLSETVPIKYILQTINCRQAEIKEPFFMVYQRSISFRCRFSILIPCIKYQHYIISALSVAQFSYASTIRFGPRRLAAAKAFTEFSLRYIYLYVICIYYVAVAHCPLGRHFRSRQTRT